ncbi:MAG: MBL fold metallo-hydrolase [Firmicutes bacterium]|nr:MBL fold metallo-hydrolase [Bacillota bacterium]
MKINHYNTGALSVNTYLVYDENSKEGFIVDPGGYSNLLENDVKETGVDIKYIILTHGHGDHIGGVAKHLENHPSAKVVAHENEAELLAEPRYNYSQECCGSSISLAADILVKDRETLNVGGIELTFIHTPGHTKGGMSIVVDKHIFSGDTLFCRSIGRTDFWGGDFRTIINSIKDRLFVFPDDTVVLPGHMGPTTIGDEKRGNPFV